jgi:hypothetical protein
LRYPQGSRQPIYEPRAPQQSPRKRHDLRPALHKSICPTHHAWLVRQIHLVERCQQLPAVERQESNAPAHGERLVVQVFEQLPNSRHDHVLRPLTQRYFHKRRRIDINMKQVGDNPARFSERPLRFLVRPPQSFLYAAGQTFQAMFQLGKHSNSLTRTSQRSLQLAKLLVRPR